VYKYVTASIEKGGLGYDEDDVILYGRSIGTGPASMLASMFNPGALIIVSPYVSIAYLIRETILSQSCCNIL
jgi:hypothetical protein